MRIRIRGGTPLLDGESLCDSCRWSRIVRGRTLDEEIVHCDASHVTPVRITFKVTSCTDYADARVPGYHELVHQAWILRPGTKRRRAGFVHGSELEGQELAEVLSEPGEPEW